MSWWRLWPRKWGRGEGQSHCSWGWEGQRISPKCSIRFTFLLLSIIFCHIMCCIYVSCVYICCVCARFVIARLLYQNLSIIWSFILENEPIYQDVGIAVVNWLTHPSIPEWRVGDNYYAIWCQSQKLGIIQRFFPVLTRCEYIIHKFFFLATPQSMQILVPQPGIEPMPPAVEAWSLNHWTAREVPP